MYKYIADVYNNSSKFEQLKDLPGTSDHPRANITQQIFKEFLASNPGRCEALEIGPGSGFITEHLSLALPDDGRCVLDIMDFSDGFLRNTGEKNFKIRDYICHDITQFQANKKYEGKYDIIFFQEVLEHLISPFISLVNIHDMLKDGGIVFLTIPNAGYWRRVYREILRQDTLLDQKVNIDTHISELSTIGLVKLVTMAGFDITRLEYYCSKGPLFKALTSEQIGLLLSKGSAPAERWKVLEGNIRSQYFKLLGSSKTT